VALRWLCKVATIRTLPKLLSLFWKRDLSLCLYFFIQTHEYFHTNLYDLASGVEWSQCSIEMAVTNTEGWGQSAHTWCHDQVKRVAVCCSVLQCGAVCCIVLQCVAVCCSVLQCVAVRCSVLQCAAVCCSELQCVAECCSVL